MNISKISLIELNSFLSFVFIINNIYGKIVLPEILFIIREDKYK